MTIQLDPFQRLVYRPFTTTPTDIHFGMTIDEGQLSITRPNGQEINGLPTGSGFSTQVAWNPAGTSVAWSHSCNYVSNTNFGNTIIVYDFSAGALTKVSEFGLGYSGQGVCWLNNTTLATSINGVVDPNAYPTPDRGISVWTRSGNSFTKSRYLYIGSNGVGHIGYKDGYIYSHTNGTLYNPTTFAVEGDAVTASSSDLSGYIVSDSGGAGVIRVYTAPGSGTTWTIEGTITLPTYTYNGTTYTFTKNDIKWSPSSNIFLISGQYGGSTASGMHKAGFVYRRNSANNYSLVSSIGDDPDSGNSFATETSDWLNNTKFAVAAYVAGSSTGNDFLYVYDDNCNYISQTGGNDAGGQARWISWRPQGDYIAWAGQNTAPFFRVYQV